LYLKKQQSGFTLVEEHVLKQLWVLIVLRKDKAQIREAGNTYG
jgi:hypothetical protein